MAPVSESGAPRRGNRPWAVNFCSTSRIALLTVIALFAVSSLRQSHRIEGSLSLIVHLRTNTCAS